LVMPKRKILILSKRSASKDAGSLCSIAGSYR